MDHVVHMVFLYAIQLTTLPPSAIAFLDWLF